MAYIFIILGVVLRLVPHAPNFAPISAMALFGGAYLNKKYALLFPMFAMLISDLFLGFHQAMIWVYISFVLIGLIGLGLKKHNDYKSVIGASILGSVLFFLITNFGVWLGPWYNHNFQGLVQCFTLAIPFFRNTLLGDLTYTAVFFGGYSLIIYFTKEIKQSKLT